MDQSSSASSEGTTQSPEVGGSTSKQLDCSDNWPIGRIRRPTTNSTTPPQLAQSLQERFSGAGFKMENGNGDMELVITAEVRILKFSGALSGGVPTSCPNQPAIQNLDAVLY